MAAADGCACGCSLAGHRAALAYRRLDLCVVVNEKFIRYTAAEGGVLLLGVCVC